MQINKQNNNELIKQIAKLNLKVIINIIKHSNVRQIMVMLCVMITTMTANSMRITKSQTQIIIAAVCVDVLLIIIN